MSASGGGNKGQRLSRGEDADVAQRAEIEQVAITRDDRAGLPPKRTGEDVIVVAVPRRKLQPGGRTGVVGGAVGAGLATATVAVAGYQVGTAISNVAGFCSKDKSGGSRPWGVCWC